ncbi:MAG TPA: phosphatidylserine decarboxylase [Candidatus Polarisedimenticolia bacterium]|jgi:phosphatidylserine decarboxylase|nr:phosphatidylserine decarboxylase [Candidatus Polarisedimenticolia bacterium]
MTVARESYPYLAVGLAVAGVAGALGFPYLSAGGMLLSGFVAYFFRDPVRVVPLEPGVVVSPGDGKVVEIRKLPGETGTLIAIFLSLFDVHINRAPVTGRIRRVDYRPGRFLPANLSRAGSENERNDLLMEGDYGEVRLSQIAGVVARRIVCWKREGDQVERGERIGLIQFGSRLEVVLPPKARPEVVLGSRVKGGSTVLARISVGVRHEEEEQLAPATAR